MERNSKKVILPPPLQRPPPRSGSNNPRQPLFFWPDAVCAVLLMVIALWTFFGTLIMYLVFLADRLRFPGIQFLSGPQVFLIVLICALAFFGAFKMTSSTKVGAVLTLVVMLGAIFYGMIAGSLSPSGFPPSLLVLLIPFALIAIYSALRLYGMGPPLN